MFSALVDIQRELHRELASYLVSFANDRDWWALLAVLPVGVLFGAVHAMTPGHSKAVMAAYLAGSRIGALRGFVTALALSATHVAMSVAIVLLSLPLVRFGFGRAGEAPALEAVSRVILAGVGLWMVWRGLRRVSERQVHHVAVGATAGLIPCPLTLFAMIFATQRGVPEAGLAFAFAMLLGVAATLSCVALGTVFLRGRLTALLADASWTKTAMRSMEIAFGVVLVVISLSEIAR